MEELLFRKGVAENQLNLIATGGTGGSINFEGPCQDEKYALTNGQQRGAKRPKSGKKVSETKKGTSVV